MLIPVLIGVVALTTSNLALGFAIGIALLFGQKMVVTLRRLAFAPRLGSS